MFGTKKSDKSTARSNGPVNRVAKLAEERPAAKSKPAVEPAKPAPEPADVESHVTKATTIEGNVTSDTSLRVDGTVRGDVRTGKQLFVGPGAVVEGNVTAEDAAIAGRVTGSVKVTGLLRILATSRIEGDVKTRNLNVESGAVFNGKFDVGHGDSTNSALDDLTAPVDVESN